MQKQTKPLPTVKKYETDCSDEEWQIVEPLLRRQGTVGAPTTIELR